MRYIFLIFILSFGAINTTWAEEEAFPGLQLVSPHIDRDDMDSIKRGGKFFAANCMSCHTAIYLKNDALAQSVGVTYERMPVNVKSWPYGITPPDLSLEANVRGVDWIYTYLHSFYQDSTRPTGVNNLLVPKTAMPGIIAAFQGTQSLVEHPMHDIYNNVQWYDLLKLEKQGSMAPDDFDATMADVVNFLAYAAEPYHQEQHAIGVWVLGFIVIMFGMLYALKKEYWKDVKRFRQGR